MESNGLASCSISASSGLYAGTEGSRSMFTGDFLDFGGIVYEC